MPFAANRPTLVESLDAWLPQTQCTRCGYPNCRAYAEAVANREADINQCPPGGEATVGALAKILGVAAKPLNPRYGRHEPRRLAVIDEARCIGCRKCLEVCPVDAIAGAHQWMHTVIAAQCSGCALCLPPCPVDCIALVPIKTTVGINDPWPDYTLAEAGGWRARTRARLARLRPKDRRSLRRHTADRDARLRDAPSAQEMRREIDAAIERVKRRRATTRKPAAEK